MTHLLYTVIFTFFLIFTAPYLLFRALIDGRFRGELIQRMGFFPSLPFKRPIWVHTTSVWDVFWPIPPLIKS
jgi:3-deoxy-D-manno-octulosonic-acid transferase